jgi:hypothetical protein
MDIQFNQLCGISFCTASIKIKGYKKEFYIAKAIDKRDAFEKVWNLIKEDYKKLF